MSSERIEFAVFTKSWRTMPLRRLGTFVHGLGFDGVELPVRPGYQVEPEDVSRGLPAAVRVLAECGVKIHSIAGSTDEATIAACAEAGVPLIRICVGIPRDTPYLEYEADLQREFEALVPLLERHGVAIGIQNHCDRFVANAMGIRHLIERFDRRHLCAVWDPAHCALNGEPPDVAAEIVWSHLGMVNMKNAVWLRTNGPEAEVASYRHHWTSLRQGLCSWPEVARQLKQRDYAGPVCLSAEYDAEDEVERLIAEDIGFAKSLLA